MQHANTKGIVARFQGGNMFGSATLEFRVDLCTNERPQAAAYRLRWDVVPHLERFILALPPDGDVRDEANPKDFWKRSIVARRGRAMGLHTH